MYAFIRFLCRVVFKIIGEPEVFGRDNIPGQGPLVLAANHQSLLDPPVLIACIPRRITFLAAAYLFKIPLVGLAVRAGGALPVDGDHGSARSVKYALSLLSRGGVIGMFPEGGLSTDGRLKPFRSGWAYFALKTGSPVLPVAIRGSRDLLPAGKYIPRRGRIKVYIGRPLPVEKRSRVRRGDLEELDRVMAATINGLLSGGKGR